ncbi:MAG: alpha/beta hydrolase-fold protein [Jatrophihabitans sp.]|uniref:alpha/beta hydrolase-fold protein n=1 Tax=Jatrophihabitans sp. TaxID=1932789 RepID=UPI0039104FF9
MTLTGPALAIMVTVATIAAMVGAFLGWSRVPGSVWMRHGLRLLLLVGNQLAAVLLVGVIANDAGNFYSSWSDLFGSGGSGALARSHVRTQATPRAGVLTSNDTGFAARGQWPLRGRLVSITVSGRVSQLRAVAFVYLPPQYFQPRYAKTSFPAIELLTGYGHPVSQLAGRGAAPDVLLRLIRRGAVPPAVLVITSAAPGVGRDTECVDVPAGPQAATFLGVDIPLAISHTYRVATVGWGIGGIGEGGYCAAKLAMLQSDVFYSGASIAGYYTPLRTAATGDLWAGSAVQRRLDDLTWRLRHLPAPPARLLVLQSPGVTSDQAFAALARPPMQVIVQDTAQPGDPARNDLPAALSWLSRHLPGPP